MNSIKLLSILALSLFLVGTISAVSVNGEFEGAAESYELTQGDSVTFSVIFISSAYPMHIEVALYNSDDNSVHVFVSGNKNEAFENTYTISKATVGNLAVGDYTIKISGEDTDGPEYADETILKLKVVGEEDNGDNGTDDGKDKDSDKKERKTYEDEYDRDAYLKQFEPKTISADEETQDSKPSPNSWIIWLIVGLIVLVVLIIVLSSLKR